MAKHEKERDALHKMIRDLNLEWLDFDKPEEEKRTCYISKGNNGLAIDFCAVSHDLQNNCRLRYGKREDYVKKDGNIPSYSDHIPLLLEVDL